MTATREPSPVIVRSGSDWITRELRQLLMPHAPLAFAESDEILTARVARDGARLVVLHSSEGIGVMGSAGRLLRAVPELSAPIVELNECRQEATVAAPHSALLDDVLCMRTERWHVLLMAWTCCPDGARQRVRELRLLHANAPTPLLPVLDALMLAPSSSLSVKQWSAGENVERTTLYRRVTTTGVTPSQLVDVVRALHIAGSWLVPGDAWRDSPRRAAASRSDDRVLARTFDLTRGQLAGGGAPGSPALIQLVAARLRAFFRRSVAPS